MKTSPKMLALRYRIWCFAAARGWDVTCNEIGEAVGESGRRIGSVLQAAGWISRVRAAEHGPETSFRGGGAARDVEQQVVRDILAGRVNSEFTA